MRPAPPMSVPDRALFYVEALGEVQPAWARGMGDEPLTSLVRRFSIGRGLFSPMRQMPIAETDGSVVFWLAPAVPTA